VTFVSEMGIYVNENVTIRHGAIIPDVTELANPLRGLWRDRRRRAGQKQLLEGGCSYLL